ncbi:hypothetical protein ACI2OX_17180 [Bacillus sp. N9]
MGVDTVIIGIIIASTPFKEAVVIAPIIAAFMHDFSPPYGFPY